MQIFPRYASCGCKASREKYESSDRKRPLGSAERYARAGIGREYQHAEGDFSEQVSALVGGRNVYVVGPNGTGKSMLVARVAMDLIGLGEDVLFVNAASEAESMKRSFDGNGSDRWMRMCDAGFLVVDDLGKGNPTEWSGDMWYTVVEARSAAGLPTLVTTNYDGGKLIAWLTPNGDDSTARAIVSRLRGGALTVKTGGPDRRLKPGG